MRTLYGLGQSLWTERARWALDHHGLRFAYHEHVPMIGEVLLRRKAGTKYATVPLLDDGGTIVMGSLAIAQHAERGGRGAPLFPRGKDTEIAHLNDVAERMARVGRAWLVRNLLQSKEAQRESLPSFVPGFLRGAFAPSAAMALKFLAKKHGVNDDVDYEVEHTLRPALLDVRAALGDKPYLLDTFTYADISIAASLQCLRPADHLKLGPATREAWTNEALARDFDDLLMWRDAVVRKHR